MVTMIRTWGNSSVWVNIFKEISLAGIFSGWGLLTYNDVLSGWRLKKQHMTIILNCFWWSYTTPGTLVCWLTFSNVYWSLTYRAWTNGLHTGRRRMRASYTMKSGNSADRLRGFDDCTSRRQFILCRCSVLVKKSCPDVTSGVSISCWRSTSIVYTKSRKRKGDWIKRDPHAGRHITNWQCALSQSTDRHWYVGRQSACGTTEGEPIRCWLTASVLLPVFQAIYMTNCRPLTHAYFSASQSWELEHSSCRRWVSGLMQVQRQSKSNKTLSLTTSMTGYDVTL